MKTLKKKENIIVISIIILLVLIVCASLIILLCNNFKKNSEQLVEKSIYLDNLPYDYSKVGFGDLTINQDNNGNTLSLYDGENEVEFEHGFFAHAYSTIVFENLSTCGFTYFESYIGVNKTARVVNTKTSLKFLIFLDNELTYTSNEFNAYSSYEYVKIDIENIDRITLVIDSLSGNGNDHGVWADSKFYYYNDIKPKIIAEDLEFASPYEVTSEDILYHVKAQTINGENITNKISYKTNFDNHAGTYNLTYHVVENGIEAQKTVKLNVLREERFVKNVDIEYLTTPFANTLYYGRWCFNIEGRKAYDFILQSLLKTNISSYQSNTITFNLQENGIYIFPGQVAQIKEYLIYDEARLYFLYDWRAGERAGTSYTEKNGLVDTVTFPLYNGSGQYYNGQDNFEAYLKSEDTLNQIFGNVSNDMTKAQIVKISQNIFSSSITYANVNYADNFYGAFVTHNCICSGYARGFMFVMQRLNIKSQYVVGSAGGAHAWNHVSIDGNWYLSDPTWGNSYCLLGYDNSLISSRTINKNFSIMPSPSGKDYDRDLINYPLFEVKDSNLVKMGEKVDLHDFIIISQTIKGKAPITNITYTGKYNINKVGEYSILLTATNSLGNTISKNVTLVVYNDTLSLSNLSPQIQKSNNVCNTSNRNVSLYQDGQEISFENGVYIKAYETIALTYDLENTDAIYFSTYFGVDKLIRDNVSYGGQVNATVRIYLNDNLVYEKTGIKWKQNFTYFSTKLDSTIKTLKIEVVDTTGQGGLGFGNPTIYK